MRFLMIAIFMISTSAFAGQPCPSSFNSFLQQFENDREFQQNNIKYPLPHSYVDQDAKPEPATVHEDLSASEVRGGKEPIYPPPSVQRSVPLKREIGASETTKKVRLEKPDTGYLLEYRFELINGCWKLVQYDDFSI